MESRTISVIHDDSLPILNQTSVKLDDGSLLRGVRSLSFKACVGEFPSLSIETFVTRQELKFLQEKTELKISLIEEQKTIEEICQKTIDLCEKGASRESVLQTIKQMFLMTNTKFETPKTIIHASSN